MQIMLNNDDKGKVKRRAQRDEENDVERNRLSYLVRTLVSSMNPLNMRG